MESLARRCIYRLRQRRLAGHFLVNGSTLEDLKTGRSPASKLYHNNHDGTFTDVTEKAAWHTGLVHGAAVGDYDNDGWDDLYITCLAGSFLYKNNGDGTFRDVTLQAGVGNLGRWARALRLEIMTATAISTSTWQITWIST